MEAVNRPPPKRLAEPAHKELGFKAADIKPAGVEPGQTLPVQTATQAIQPDRELPERAALNKFAKLTPNLTVAKPVATDKVDRKPPSGKRARMAYTVVTRLQRPNKEGGKTTPAGKLLSP